MSVIVVDAAKLDDYLGDVREHSTPGPVFMRFKRDGCGHCEAMSDDFKQAAALLEDKANVIEVEVPFGIEDLSHHESTQKFVKAGQGVPRMYMVDGDNVSEYDGDRSAKAMVDAMEDFMAKGMSGGRRPRRRATRRTSRRRARARTCRRPRCGRPRCGRPCCGRRRTKGRRATRRRRSNRRR